LNITPQKPPEDLKQALITEYNKLKEAKKPSEKTEIEKNIE